MHSSQQTIQWLAAIAVFAAYGPSCRSRPHQATTSEFEVANDMDFNDKDITQSAEAKRKAKAEESAAKMEHPVKADAWQTRKLIMTHKQPDPESIMNCKDAAESAISETTNLRELSEASITLESKVTESKSTYHWCFYQLTADLDLRLERETPLLKDKANLFLNRIRTLWVIAKALDSGDAKTPYTHYLKSRYIEISQHVFGRTVENMDEDNLLVTAGKSGKGAGTFSDP